MINQAGESFYIQTYNHFSMWLIQSVTGTGGWNATSASLLFPDMARLFGRPWFFLYTGLWGQCVCVCVCVRMQVCVMPLLSNLYFVCWVTSVMSDSFATLWTVARQAPLSMGFSGQEYWSGLSIPPSGDLRTQGSNAELPHCRQILYRLCPQGSPKLAPIWIICWCWIYTTKPNHS